MIPVVDRVPTYPNRIKLTHSDGSVEYVTWERADAPTVEGTPINKALFDSIAKDLGLSGPTTIYVSKTGSNTLGNGTEASPYATIQYAINSLPKNLGGNIAFINIGAGTYAEHVNIEFFSNGRVTLTGVSDAVVTVNGITIRGCAVNLEYIHTHVLTDGIYVTMSADLFLGPNTKLTCTGGTEGLYCRYNSRAAMNGSVTINNTTSSAVRSGATCEIFLNDIAGSGNNIGFYAAGGTIMINKTTLTYKTAYTTGTGGRVLTGSQTKAPDY